MTWPGLAQRDADLRELMDDPHCDPSRLQRTYAQFRVVNRLVAGWGGVYRRLVRPMLHPARSTSLLDIGSGAGDVPRALARWAGRDGLALSVTAIDPDERAHTYAITRPALPGVVFRCASSAELVAEGACFDLVTSNHVLHHLDDTARDGLLADSVRLARRRVVHSDIARSRPAYLGYAIASRPFGRRSFISVDGLRSIRRSYRPAELAAVVPEPWRVTRRAPARLLLVLDADADADAKTTAEQRVGG